MQHFFKKISLNLLFVVSIFFYPNLPINYYYIYHHEFTITNPTSIFVIIVNCNMLAIIYWQLNTINNQIHQHNITEEFYLEFRRLTSFQAKNHVFVQ